MIPRHCLSDLGNDFKLATGINKRLIYATDINSDDINNGQLKTLFSNEEVTINGKYEKPYKARCQSAFFFNCNTPPRINLSDTGMLRRILYYSMDKKIENPDKTMAKREYSIYELTNIVAHALAIDMKGWQKNFEKDTRYNLLKDNTVFIYYALDVYEDYKYKCRASNLNPFSEPKWRMIRELIKEWGGPFNITPIHNQEPLTQTELEELGF